MNKIWYSVNHQEILICLTQDFTQHFSQSLDCDKWPAALESRNICLQDHDDHNMLEIEQTSCGCIELDTKLCSPETKKTWMTTTYSCLLIIFLCVEYNTFQFVTNMVSHPNIFSSTIQQLWAYRPRTAPCPRWRSPEFAPWCLKIYQHLSHKWASYVGKYTIRDMEHMGKILVFPCIS